MIDALDIHVLVWYLICKGLRVLFVWSRTRVCMGLQPLWVWTKNLLFNGTKNSGLHMSKNHGLYFTRSPFQSLYLF